MKRSRLVSRAKRDTSDWDIARRIRSTELGPADRVVALLQQISPRFATEPLVRFILDEKVRHRIECRCQDAWQRKTVGGSSGTTSRTTPGTCCLSSGNRRSRLPRPSSTRSAVTAARLYRCHPALPSLCVGGAERHSGPGCLMAGKLEICSRRCALQRHPGGPPRHPDPPTGRRRPPRTRPAICSPSPRGVSRPTGQNPSLVSRTR